ncbi:MAG: S41 family peptidase [Chitinophagales bacterium]
MRINIFLQFALAFVLLNGPIVVNGQNKANKGVEQSLVKLNKTIELLNKHYIEEVDVEKVTEQAVVAMLKELDPHSVYFSKKEYAKSNESLEGNFEGIGIRFGIVKDTVIVLETMRHTPAYKANLKVGDQIIRIDGVLLTGKSLTRKMVSEHLKGERGSEVALLVKRRGLTRALKFNITRKKIPITSVKASYMASPTIGYIKLTRFSRNALNELRNALKDLEKKGMESLILDLRGNVGGYLTSAIHIADEFLSKGKLITYTQGNTSPRRSYFASNKGRFQSKKLALLIDEGSASASEIVAGAIQDWDRGVIIGRRSFGKGLVQKPFILPDSSFIRLTIAKYHTPSGRCIQKSYEEGKDNYRKEVNYRIKQGITTDLDLAKSYLSADSLKYFTKINRRVVYGGGGIMPDVFIPQDTSYLSKTQKMLERSGVYQLFVANYVTTLNEDIDLEYFSPKHFNHVFMVSEKEFQAFVDFANEYEIALDEEQAKLVKKMIKTKIKAYLAKYLWTENAYNMVLNEKNAAFQKAKQILENQSKFNESLTVFGAE